MRSLIRLILTVLLLVIVWHHAHWSVAFAITFIFLTLEVNAASHYLRDERLKELPFVKRYMEEHEQRNQSAV